MICLWWTQTAPRKAMPRPQRCTPSSKRWGLNAGPRRGRGGVGSWAGHLAPRHGDSPTPPPPTASATLAGEEEGLQQLQGLLGQRHHQPGHPTSLDHAALHHAAEHGGDHGVHGRARQGRCHGGPLREVCSAPLLPAACTGPQRWGAKGGGGAGCMVVVTLVVDRLLGMLPTNTCAGTCGTPHQAAVHVQ